MTVVVAVKVFDGIVVAADSATTIQLPNGSHQVYNHANKIFQLHRNKPIAAATWGLGTLGPASISTVAKDLRRRLMGADHHHADWALADDYTVKGVSERVVEMMFDDLYSPLVSSGQMPRGDLGFLVAGYAHNGDNWEAELWTIEMSDPATRPIPTLVAGAGQFGWTAHAIKEAVGRLFNGYDPSLPDLLAQIVTDPSQQAAIQQALQTLHRIPAPAGMPFLDAIHLARFLADTTIGYTHYLLGPDVVGGTVEIAGISRHEGFKWVSRKHYYVPELNPREPGHDA